MIKELSDLAEKAEDPEQFLAAALDRMPRVLVRRLMDDIFAEEKMAGLWEEVRWVPELIVGPEDTQQTSPATNSCLDAMPRLPQPLGNAAFH